MFILVPGVFMCLVLAVYNFLGHEDINLRALVHYYFSAALTFTTLYILATVRQKMIAHHDIKLLDKSESWNFLFKDHVFWGKLIILQSLGCLFYTSIFLIDIMHQPFNAMAVMSIAMSIGVALFTIGYAISFIQNNSILDFLDRGIVRLVFYGSFIVLAASAGLSPLTGLHVVIVTSFMVFIWMVSVISKRMVAEVFRGFT